ncbi:V-type ATP synthase subunit E [Sediminispirochaeta smaragdinae]|jgi:V/A-type H+-transporting ATPase subunit E|uniref:V-type ATP synthase subunit E n=1 Tax=Sediminispirochaeta smaragdinae (strain DSM 11293 / JCM 15392 / SEBR 4228) TaxID=573413 RepID=E1R3E4_SEDSS|nr:V-type ATP synthase subunit E [Sediminispirochaeta smaragdinae]ADK81575.1 V-type ATP synthase subunit E [Sediminispirochaeta smaragdinae DSM 11293]
MDVQLKELIETIKSEGVDNAEAQAKEIVNEAQKKRNEIIADAEQEAARIREKAEEDAAKMQATAEESIRQAGRDLLLSLESSITSMLDAVVKKEAASALTGEGLSKAIVALLSNWSEEKDSLELLLPENERVEVEEYLKKALGTKMKKGVTVKPVAGIEAGFKIAEEGGSAYYNFTADGIAEILSQYVSPRLSSLLRESVKGQKE